MPGGWNRDTVIEIVIVIIIVVVTKRPCETVSDQSDQSGSHLDGCLGWMPRTPLSMDEGGRVGGRASVVCSECGRAGAGNGARANRNRSNIS